MKEYGKGFSRAKKVCLLLQPDFLSYIFLSCESHNYEHLEDTAPLNAASFIKE